MGNGFISQKILLTSFRYCTVLLVICFTSIPADCDTLSIGYFTLRPHMYENQGRADGAAIRHFEMIAGKMGHSVRWVGPLPFPRLVNDLKQGKIDGAQMVSKNLQRTAYLYYPDLPYFPVYSMFAIKKENKLEKITSIDDVDGYRIGFLQDANLSKFVRDNRDHFQITLLHGNTWVSQNLKKVLLNRLDAAYDINHITLIYEAHKLGIKNRFKFLKLPEPPMHVYTVFAKAAKKGETYVRQYNQLEKNLLDSYTNYVDTELDRLENEMTPPQE